MKMLIFWHVIQSMEIGINRLGCSTPSKIILKHEDSFDRRRQAVEGSRKGLLPLIEEVS